MNLAAYKPTAVTDPKVEFNQELGFLPTIPVIAGSAPGIFEGGKKVIGGIKDIFGGGPERNAGTASLVDTLDNFESITTSQANTVANQIMSWIEQGMSDEEIYSKMKSIRGVSQSRSLSDDWKYQLVQQKIDSIRASMQSNGYFGSNNSNAGFNVSPNLILGTMALTTIGGLGYVMIKKKKKK